MGSNDQIMERGRKLLTNAFSSKLNSVNPEKFTRPWWETHLKTNPNQSLELWTDFFARLMVEWFQESSKVFILLTLTCGTKYII